MSLTSKLIFLASSLTTTSIIFYVHYKQQLDKEQLHLGVVRDQERQERRKRENVYILQKQIVLGEELRKEQEKGTT